MNLESGSRSLPGPKGPIDQTAPARPVAIPEDPAERLRYYRLDGVIETLPSLERRKEDIRFDPARDDVNQYYFRAPVGSLDDLKLWMGFPNDHIDHTRHWQHLRGVAVPWVAPDKGADLLRGVGPEVIADAEYNVLHGYVDEVLLNHAFWGAIVQGLLERMRFVDILAIDHLIVEDKQTYTISNTPTAYFNSVTVYGSGSIVFETPCKLIADTIEHI